MWVCLFFQVDNDECVKKVLSGGVGGESKKDRGDKEEKRDKDRTRSASRRKEEVSGSCLHAFYIYFFNWFILLLNIIMDIHALASHYRTHQVQS